MTVKWLLGILAALIVSLVGAGIVSGISTASEQAQRISVVETQYGSLQRGQERIERQLEALGEKLDRALQRPR